MLKVGTNVDASYDVQVKNFEHDGIEYVGVLMLRPNPGVEVGSHFRATRNGDCLGHVDHQLRYRPQGKKIRPARPQRVLPACFNSGCRKALFQRGVRAKDVKPEMHVALVSKGFDVQVVGVVDVFADLQHKRHRVGGA